MAVKQITAESNVAPNLVPMVDIMFLLLLFLMIGADMQQRELEEVALPVASTVKKDEQELDMTKPENYRVTVNVHHEWSGCPDYSLDGGVCRNDEHWQTAIRGVNYNKGDELKNELLRQVEIDREKRGERVVAEAGKLKPPSELRVMIRADRAALYSHVQRAMNACGDAGIYKIEIGAAERRPE
jgi:biopolymer transport protein ExbD